MARRIPTRLNLLTVRQVQTAGDGDHNDGGGLVLRVRGSSVAWVFRFTSPIGKRREMGLGICDRNNPTIAGRSLTDARKLGQDARALLQESIDPIDARDARKAALRAEAEEKKSEARREQLTLARAARRYHEGTIEPSRSVKHGGEWIRSLENHMPGAIWHKPISEVTAPELLDFMSELFGNVPETARRILQRLTVVFDDAMFRGECLANPAAAIKRKLREARRGTKRGNFAAMAYAKVPAFIQALRQVEGVAARCLEFTIYTASRTGESIGASWSEFDLAAGVFTIPGNRMKGGESHVVHLSARTLAILEQQKGLNATYVFPGRNGAPLSNMALLMALRRMKVADEATVHGFRSSFSSWAYETAAATPDAIEAALAHREGDKVKRAYNRAQFLAERARLMNTWGSYLDGREPASNILELPRRAA